MEYIEEAVEMLRFELIKNSWASAEDIELVLRSFRYDLLEQFNGTYIWSNRSVSKPFGDFRFSS